MYRVKSIETVFCYASLHKSSCSIIYIKNYASHYRADYPVVYHQNKYAKKLQTSTIYERVVISIKKVKYNNNKNSSPLIIHSKPERRVRPCQMSKEIQVLDYAAENFQEP